MRPLFLLHVCHGNEPDPIRCVYLAENSGARGVYVLTGHSRKYRCELTGDRPVVAGIREAAERVVCATETHE